MSISPGTRLGQYDLQSRLGGGGMGEVWKAYDPRLQRTVAIKVLHARADDARTEDAASRILQEARAASALHHPHICVIYEVGESDPSAGSGQAVSFIVMEHVEGKPLSKLIPADGLPPETVIRYGTQIAAALAHAHEHGIVHRDLKSANVVITPDAQVKLIDFGIAVPLAKPEADALTRTMESPVSSAPMGTLAYMAPEVLNGHEATARSDIWSLGVLLYEMASGQLPFGGATPLDVVSAIAKDAPRPLPSRVSAGLRSVVQRCLHKEAGSRYSHASAVEAALATIQSDTAVAPTSTMAPRLSQWTWRLAAVVVVVAVGALALLWPRAPERVGPRVGRTIQITREPRLELDAAISPDGTLVAYAAGDWKAMKIYVQQVSGGRPVALTEDIPGGHRLPRWTPDGTRVAFHRVGDGQWFSVPALGGAPRPLPWSGGRSLAWSPAGDAVAYASDEAIFVAPSGGGEPRKVADAFEPSALSWSPDGTHIAFTSGNGAYIGVSVDGTPLNIAPSSIKVIAVSDAELVRTTDGTHFDFGPVWSADGTNLFFVSDRGGGRDIYRLDLLSSDEPERLTTGLNVFTITLSSDGRKLAYSVITISQNIWSIPVSSEPPISVTDAVAVTTGNQAIEGVDVSPDGQWMAFDSTRSGNQDIYKMPLGGGEPVQLTTDPAMDCCPAWSPDGRELAFHSFRTGNRDIFVVSPEGGTPSQITNNPAQDRYPNWSPDGHDIVFSSDEQTYIVSRKRGEVGGETPRQLTSDAAVAERVSKWSPNGDVIAYSGAGGVRVVSSAGGTPRIVSSFGDSPLWSRSGKTLYFRDPTGIWSVPASGGDPRMLVRFDDPRRVPIRYEWSTDGKRFYFTLTEYESDVWVMELEQERE